MAATIFDFVSEELQARSDLAKLEARGTVRLALKESGLDAQSVTNHQMQVVLAQVLPTELANRGVESAGEICAAVAAALKQAGPTLSQAGETSPEAVFRRLARR